MRKSYKNYTYWPHSFERPTRWTTHDERWYDHYLELKAYKEEFGDCNVPRNWPTNKSLSLWVKYQRSEKSTMVDWRKKLLEALDFTWQRQTKNRT